MFFGKKPKCPRCKSKLNDEFSFCPYCGLSLIDPEKEMRDFGMLGKNDSLSTPIAPEMQFADQIFSTLVNSLAKSIDQQIKEMEKTQIQPNIENAEIKALPNGFSIRIGPVPIHQAHPQQKPPQQNKKAISDEQLKKMSSFPRTEAKTKVRRLSNSIVYEMAAPGIESIKDIFISKLESGYEIKAIGKNKVYTNTIPVTLPIKRYSIDPEKLYIEFLSQG